MDLAKYKKEKLEDHIYLNPDTYVGGCDLIEENLPVWSEDKIEFKFVQQLIRPKDNFHLFREYIPEYEYEKKILRKGDKLIDTYIDFYNTIYTGLFNSDKRKKYPIDQFRSFLGFEEE